ncbi:5-methyltetrahydrofolate:corrinoid/iron-sulfur protein co-methyltransferase [Sporomusa ovata DSM 2662]|uniref:5-methyltetrahydrofolate:corrinoid iron-sulfur protein methyltransferase n=1 Tax=Sporomusa ovata TaxID=2378 RepID=A0A0U1KYH4_9FIRM|nr:methyltetrahydrofolate cobalamin methyltransferase [Sporomusa ovata]EQB29036.1 methyltetrahydrofolate:corrinoid/iron-sulfur protein methyltransferase AcsE [Sporomusa ovata DSM 2662]CQR72468.1 5-methyltetrahydrofolate:corrinoid iron-sulfur protein methyltransferase [Sporomusa ovata]
MIIIGERINGMFKDIGLAIREHDPKPLQEWAVKQKEGGAHYLDVNTGPNSEDQTVDLPWMINVVKEVSDLPLAIDTTNYDAMEAALIAYGKPGALINSIGCEQEKIDRVFPMAAKYQADVVCLCINKVGIPKSAEDRVAMAMEFVANAEAYGLQPDNLFIDPIILPVNVAQEHGIEALETIRQIKMISNPPPKTTVGLSNISQKSPHRPLINRTFAIMAMTAGLDSAICDANDEALVDAIATARLILNQDIYCDSYAKVFRQR